MITVLAGAILSASLLAWLPLSVTLAAMRMLSETAITAVTFPAALFLLWKSSGLRGWWVAAGALMAGWALGELWLAFLWQQRAAGDQVVDQLVDLGGMVG